MLSSQVSGLVRLRTLDIRRRVPLRLVVRHIEPLVAPKVAARCCASFLAKLVGDVAELAFSRLCRPGKSATAPQGVALVQPSLGPGITSNRQISPGASSRLGTRSLEFRPILRPTRAWAEDGSVTPHRESVIDSKVETKNAALGALRAGRAPSARLRGHMAPRNMLDPRPACNRLGSTYL